MSAGGRWCRGVSTRRWPRGFDGAYLDMIVTYEEIPANAAGTARADLASKMVDLIAQVSQYARSQKPGFKVVPQNNPELWSWPKYLPAIDGLGMEQMYYQDTASPCNLDWCQANRAGTWRQCGRRASWCCRSTTRAERLKSAAPTGRRGRRDSCPTSARWISITATSPAWRPSRPAISDQAAAGNSYRLGWRLIGFQGVSRWESGLSPGSELRSCRRVCYTPDHGRTECAAMLRLLLWTWALARAGATPVGDRSAVGVCVK